jgi:outer membrane protein assembly factor BamB
MACSPLIENDRIWFMTNRADVVCLDIAPLRRDGGEPKPLWNVDLIRQFGVFPRGSLMNIAHLCSIATYKEYIYVITGTGVDDAGVKVPNPDAPSLICFNKSTGKLVWSDNSPGANLLLGQWSSPTIIEMDGSAQCITPQGDGWVRSFEALSGKLLWQFDMNRKESRWGYWRTSRYDVLASPVFAHNRIYIGSGMHPTWDNGGAGRLVCIDPTKRGDISTELAVDAKGKIVPPRRIQGIDPALGEKAVPNPNSGLVWEFTHLGDGKTFSDVMHGTVSNVAVHDGLVIAIDFAGVLHCLDAKTGKHHWSQETFTDCHGAPLIVNDKVYIGTEDGRVVIVGLSPDPEKALRKISGGYEPLYEVQLDTAIYCSPIFANGVLYLATQNTLFAIGADDDKDALNASSTGALKAFGPANKTHDRAAHAVFVPTPQDTVETMLELANVKKSDVVYDLGSGDGRIVITAAKKYGCRSIGYESDKGLIELSRAKAEAAGVQSIATFKSSDIFDADFRDADVITLYLLPRQLEKLLPQLGKLKPGARIVSHHFGIPGVAPDKVVKFKSPEDSAERTIYLWTTPLKIEAE